MESKRLLLILLYSVKSTGFPEDKFVNFVKYFLLTYTETFIINIILFAC